MARFWEKASGWEYEVLRLLPEEEARGVCGRAYDQGARRMLVTWWAWPVMALVFLPVAALSILVWQAVALVGLGGFGGFLAELLVLHPIYFHIMRPSLPPLLRPFVREQLYLLVQNGLPADHPLLQLSRATLGSELVASGRVHP